MFLLKEPAVTFPGTETKEHSGRTLNQGIKVISYDYEFEERNQSI